MGLYNFSFTPLRKRRYAKNKLLEAAKQLKRAEKQKLKQLQLKDISRAERALIHQIRERTEEKNCNNITRTKAYLDYFYEFPEIHWSFLAHMVSRNAGWNMTDLKGELLSELLEKEARQSLFLFLERGNWLIFQDVYPQLLLYAESLKRGEALFHLLGPLNASIYMEVMWNCYWKNKNSRQLALATIVNEQNYLEAQLLQKTSFKQVLHTPAFHVQELLKLNHILFPAARDLSAIPRLAGKTVHHFASLNERIELGIQLYRLVFDDNINFEEISAWAKSRPHTGSRKDYWPQLFSAYRETTPGSHPSIKIKECKLLSDAVRLYSPFLEEAWKTIQHKKADTADWFHDWKTLDYLVEEKCGDKGDIQHVYCDTLDRLQLIAQMKSAVSDILVEVF